jgi:hypothetical protein
MSLRRCQDEVSSAEFGEWLALWQLEAEESGEGEPTPEQLNAKMAAFVSQHSAEQPRGAFMERVK